MVSNPKASLELSFHGYLPGILPLLLVRRSVREGGLRLRNVLRSTRIKNKFTAKVIIILNAVN